MGINPKSLDPAMLAKLMVHDVTPARPVAEPEPAKERPLLPASVRLEGERLVIVLPVRTVSEANERGWKGRARRTTDARRIVSRTLGAHLAKLVPFAEAYHRGEALHVVFTRCGGRRLDALANLGAALKATEDAVALMMGADDGSPQWHASTAQETAGDVGVMATIEVWK